MYPYLLVALGGAIGSVARFALSGLVGRHAGDAFPWGTLLVNVTGSLLIGVLAAWVAFSPRMTHDSRQFVTHLLIVGLCGGYTTFSAFSLQTLAQLQARQWSAAGANIALSVLLCLLVTALGFWIGQTLFAPTRP